MSNVLVTGITGYVGAALAPRLLADGHAVRGFARDESRVELDVPVVEGDAVSGAGLDRALDGIDVAYYLIHSMEAATNGGFADAERRAVAGFAEKAAAAGVERVVYLGGLVPDAHDASPHLASRLAVEKLLLETLPGATALRASIVIAARSRSFRFLVRLVERLPVLALPAWRENRTAPIDGRDVIELLARAGFDDSVAGQSLDIAGPDTVSYGELIDRVRDWMLVDRPRVRLRFSATPLAAPVAAALASEDVGLIAPLMGGLDTDLLPRDGRAAELLGVKMHPLDRAIEHALADWEAAEPLKAR
jgi:uncharacterized protein YbjT (DUF2867 family)